MSVHTPFYESPRNVILLVLIMLGIFAYSGIFVVLSNQLTTKPNATVVPTASSLSRQDKDNQKTVSLLTEIKNLTDKNIHWQEAKREESYYPALYDEDRERRVAINGYAKRGTTSASLKIGKNFIDDNILVKDGWVFHPGIMGNAPGGGSWGYIKKFGKTKRTLILGYQSFGFLKDNDPSLVEESNRPTEFSIFVSDEF